MHIREKGLAHPLQDRVSEFNKNELLPTLAKACDQLVEPDQHVRIDRLEIDVGPISIDKLEFMLKDGIVKQFKNQVQEMVLKNPSLLEKTPVARDISPSGETEAEIKLYTKIDLFLFFLEQGTIPWWYPVAEFNMKDVVDEIMLHSPKVFREKVTPLLISRSLRLRLTDTLTDKQIQQFIDPENQSELRLLWKELRIQFQLGFFAPHTLHKTKLTVFENVLSTLNFKESIPRTRKKIKRAILQSVIMLQPKPFSPIVKSGKIPFEEFKENALLSKLVKDLSVEDLEKTIRDLATVKTDKVEDVSLIPSKSEDEPLPKYKSREDTFVEINNAGIVILWPYLEMFFEELDLLKNKSFVDEASGWKAVHLLHFLAFGNEEAEEHQWALNKILCGMYFSDFVPIEFTLNKSEKAECNNLLQSVINNWKALKNTSVLGLQQTFLKRNGLLKKDMQGHIVEIEKTAIDVLLDKLSWPLSVIKLPWNDELIHVRW